MAQQQRRRGGRNKPPSGHLIGRTAAARLLGCARNTLLRLEKECELVPAIVIPADGSRWYDRAVVESFAVVWNKTRRRPPTKSSTARKKPRKRQKVAVVVEQAGEAPLYDPSPETIYDPDPEQVATARPQVTTGATETAIAKETHATPGATPKKKHLPEVRAEWFAEDFKPSY